MAQIKKIVKPGDLIRGAKVGLAGLDKDGNVIGTPGIAVPNPAAGDDGKYLYNNNGTLAWAIPTGTFSIVSPTVSCEDDEGNPITVTTVQSTAIKLSTCTYLFVRINMPLFLQNTTIRLTISDIPVATFAQKYPYINWGTNQMGVLLRDSNTQYFETTIPTGSSLIVINSLIV